MSLENQEYFLLRRRYQPRAAIITLTLILSFATSPAFAGAKTDGSLGPIQTLSGAFVIPQTLGTIKGANLFHSFQSFSIAKGESATFTTTSPFQNVISRVTGGEISNINGLLQLSAATGSAPNFFFINPAGVTFGAGAAIDVPAGFHVSTANYLKFAEGNFYANPSSASTLSAAAPEAFGFLGSTRATVLVNDNARLITKALQPISIVAGDIDIDSANVSAIGGNLRVVASGSGNQEVNLTDALPTVNGRLNLVNGGSISASGIDEIDGGLVQVSAGDIAIGNQKIFSQRGILSEANVGTGNAGNIEVMASGKISILNGARISSLTHTSGNAGSVTINANSIEIDGQDSRTGIFSSSEEGAGNAGNIDIKIRGNLELLNYGEISSSTFTSGKAGAVHINAENIAIREHGGVFVVAGGNELNASAAGSIDINATNAISLSTGGKISSSTYTDGNAGPITIKAQSMTIDGSGSEVRSFTIGGSGNGGAIDITTTETLLISDGGQIASSTRLLGAAGSVKVTAKNILLDGKASTEVTGIFSDVTTNGTGDGGLIEIRAAERLTLENGAQISSSTESFGANSFLRKSGNAGSINIFAANLDINGHGVADGNHTHTTGILSRANAREADLHSRGNGGQVNVNVTGNLNIINGGQISSSTSAAGVAGALDVNAGNMNIDGYGAAVNTGIFSAANLSNSFPNGAKARTGNAGTVNVTTSGKLNLKNGAEISSSSFAGGAFDTTGTARQVRIHAGTLMVGENASISSEAGSESLGFAGNVMIIADDSITLSNGTLSIRNNATVSDPTIPGKTLLSLSAPVVILQDGKITASSTGNLAASDIQLNSTGRVRLNSSAITTSAVKGDGGAIVIKNDGSLILSHSQITTSVTGDSIGNGGDITVTTPLLVLNTGFIQANTTVPAAKGGDVNINVDAVISSANTLFVGGDPLVFNASRFGVNVIQAAAPDGVNGAVQISSPQIDLSGSLLSLSTQLVDFSELGLDPCRIGAGSSLTPVGRGGMPPSAAELMRP